MKLTPNFYRDRVCLNVLAGSRANASARTHNISARRINAQQPRAAQQLA